MWGEVIKGTKAHVKTIQPACLWWPCLAYLTVSPPTCKAALPGLMQRCRQLSGAGEPSDHTQLYVGLP